MSPSAAALPEILRGEGLPAFEAITPDAVSAHIPVLIAELEAELTALEQKLEAQLAAAGPLLSWSAVLDPLQRLGELAALELGRRESSQRCVQQP